MDELELARSIEELTDGKCQFDIRYNGANGDNYTGPAVPYILNLLDQCGIDVKDPTNQTVDINFSRYVKQFEKKFGLNPDGILSMADLNVLREKAKQNVPKNIEEDDPQPGDTLYGQDDARYQYPHYDPFFINASDKASRKNHKDIVISIGDGSNVKTIKDVFMRSVSLEVDTSGKPITEVYQFIARDIKESDASEDNSKYIGEEKELSASSDIKYTYDTLYKEK